MAGRLGGMELLHYLFLPGGWKPLSGKLCFVCDPCSDLYGFVVIFKYIFIDHFTLHQLPNISSSLALCRFFQKYFLDLTIKAGRFTSVFFFFDPSKLALSDLKFKIIRIHLSSATVFIHLLLYF